MESENTNEKCVLRVKSGPSFSAVRFAIVSQFSRRKRRRRRRQLHTFRIDL